MIGKSDSEVARIGKVWAGWDKPALTNADKYVVRIHRRLPNPMACLAVAAILSIGLALRQDDNG